MPGGLTRCRGGVALHHAVEASGPAAVHGVEVVGATRGLMQLSAGGCMCIELQHGQVPQFEERSHKRKEEN